MLSGAGRVNYSMLRLVHKVSLQRLDLQPYALWLRDTGTSGGRPALLFVIETRKTPRQWLSAQAWGKASVAWKAWAGIPSSHQVNQHLEAAQFTRAFVTAWAAKR